MERQNHEPTVESGIRLAERSFEGTVQNIREHSAKLGERLNDPEFMNRLADVVKQKAGGFLERALKEGGFLRSLAERLGFVQAGKGAIERKAGIEASADELASVTKSCRSITETSDPSKRSETMRSVAKSIAEMEKRGVDTSASLMKMPGDSSLIKKLGIDPDSADFKKAAQTYPDGSVGIPHSFLKRALETSAASVPNAPTATLEASKKTASRPSEGAEKNLEAVSQKVIGNGDKLKKDLDAIKSGASIFQVGPAVDRAAVKIDAYLRENSQDLRTLGSNRDSLDPASANRISSQIRELSEGLKKASSHPIVPKESQSRMAAFLPAVERIRSDFA